MRNLCILVLLCLAGCSANKENTTAPLHVNDPHMQANAGQARVKHLDLDINVDFEKQKISGIAHWTFDQLAETDSIVFDTKKLTIHKVTLANGKEVAFRLHEETEHLGSALSIPINANTNKVSIHYATHPDAGALQWLPANLTAGKQHPFLFTQSQPILARSWVPCQDGPAVRFTYNATVRVPRGLMALMSAINPQQKSADGVYAFHQPYAIPSYLMALAVGDVAFKAVDERAGVYAEPSVVDKAAWEFADMGKMIDEAEKLYGPYRWGRYDVLVLPASFPYGGMENPILTFATPTIIAGDRSLVSLVAHELAHSWSGNLVTNATWDDMWLNEGFTTYFERRITEAVYGKEEAQMLEVLGRQDLVNDLERIGKESPFTQLKTNTAGNDPDLVSSNIPYEKGYFFLRTIEEVTGRQRFDSFLAKHFSTHAFQSTTTEAFLHNLEEEFADIPNFKEKVGIQEWVYQPGLPNNIPPSVSPAFAAIDSMLNAVAQNKNYTGLSRQLTSTNQLLYFLRGLPHTLTLAEMQAIDNEFGFTRSGNAELQAAWFTIAIRNRYTPAYAALEDFLINIGRRKFLLPLYREMIKTPGSLQMAKQIYAKARQNYHPISYGSIDALFDEAKP